MNPHRYAHLIFDKGAKKIYDGEKTNVAGKSGYPSSKKLKLIHVYHPILVSTQNGLRTLISDLKL
jgi:hypothetical protein